MKINHPSVELLEARIAPAIVTGTLPLSTLDGAHGIKITGPNDFGELGYTVSSAGDINGDGIPDFAVTAPEALQAHGEVYVIYGGPGLKPLSSLDLSSINAGDGTHGFAITDNGAGSFTGYSVSPAGDVNGDGVGDLIVGAQDDGQSGKAAGAAYVIFGKKGGLPAVINVKSDLTGANGFKIVGETAGDHVGASVSAGDVNHDGLNDLIIGAPDRNGSTGSVYIVFGKTSFSAELDLSTLDGTAGFRIDGAATGDLFGHGVSVVGDLTQDGIADFLVGAPGANSSAGAAYLFKGSSSAATSPVAVSSNLLSKVTGAATGDQFGWSVSGAGDVNGDGTPDLMIGARTGNSGTGAAYVLAGPAHGIPFAPLFSIANAGALTLTGETGGSLFGYTVHPAGDVNGDGFADFIVGAPLTSSNTGASYVFFGHSGGLSGTISGSSLTGANGFKIAGDRQDDESGAGADGIGDVNGDGYSDLLVGAPGAAGLSGAAYVIYGGPSGLAAGHLAVNIINGAAQFNDVDGDLVTVKLKTPIQASNIDLIVKSIGATNASQLLGLELGSEFEGSDLSITVKKAPGGDGRVNVGFIDAHGVDLGAVTVMGDLGKIVAGSGGTKPALKSLTVYSLGAFGGTTEETGSDHTSVLTGSVGPVKILGDVRDAILEVLPTATAGSGKIASLTITGSLIGGRSNALGDIYAGSMGPVTIGGSIVGGSGSSTGDLNAGSFSSITIGGSLIGSSGDVSGVIYSGAIKGLVPNAVGAVGVVKIGGSIFGGTGDGSGNLLGTTFAPVSIGGSVFGGKGGGSGDISGTTFAPVSIVGSVIGSSGNGSGKLTGTTFATVSIGGSVSGGKGNGSGSLFGTTTSTINIGGSLRGGAGQESGSLEAGSFGNITIHGDQIGGSGESSALIVSFADNGKIGKVFIGGSQIGWATAEGAYIYALGSNGSIAGVTIAGDARAGSVDFSGGIFAVGGIGPVLIKGSVVGQADAPYTFRGGGALTGATSVAIASLTVGGNFEHVRVLGGYGNNSALINGHAQIGAISIGRDWIASSVLAGVADFDGFSFIGNGFDTLIQAGASTAISSIASLTIKGHASGSPELGDHFGIEAKQIGSVTIGGVKLALVTGQANDTAGFAIGATPDFTVREVAN